MKKMKLFLLPYLVVLIIPMFTMIVGHFYAYQIIQDDATLYHQSLMNRAKMAGDTMLDQVRTEVLLLAEDDKIGKLGQKENWSGEDMYDVRDLRDRMQDICQNDIAIDRMGIYFFRNGSYVTDVNRYAGPLTTFYEQEQGVTVEELWDEMPSIEGFFVLKSQNLYYYRKIYDSRYREVQAVIYAVMPWINIADALPLSDSLQEQMVLVMEDGSRLGEAYDKGGVNKIEESYFSWERLPEERELTFLKLSEEYILSAEHSDILNMKYCILTPKKALFQKISYLSWLVAGEVVICLVIGVFFSLHFARRSYSPLERMLKLLDAGKGERESGTVNYEKLEAGLTEMLVGKKSLEKQLYRSRNQQDEQWIVSLLKNGYFPGMETKERQERLENRLDVTRYRVLLFTIEELENCAFLHSGRQEDEYEAGALLRFSVKNVLEENLKLEACHGILLEMEDVIAAMVPGEKEAEKNLMMTLRSCADFFEETFRIRVCVAISSWHQQWEELSTAYEEAFQVMTYKNFWGEELENVLLYQEEKEERSRRRGNNLLDQQKKLSNCLLTKKYEEASIVLDEILEKVFEKDFRYLSYNQCQASAIIGTMLDCLEEYPMSEENGDVGEDWELFSQRLLETKSLVALKKELHNILDEIVENRKAVCGDEPEWLYEVKKYIDENYMDYNLNISHIANQFGMSTSHLGSRFRSLTGISMLDYIHSIRLQAAKEKLLSGMTVKACAEETGYSDVKTFNRAFKRYEGITPGQYKENAEKLE